ncbi:MAG TPA: glycosyl hydrolase family 18 protein [Patescibacteria group bacterium]
MKRNLFLIAFSILTALAGFVFFKTHSEKRLASVEVQVPTPQNNPASNGNQSHLYVTAWLPYWSKTEGAAALENNFSLFDEINPFALGVNPDGSLSDNLKLSQAPWPQLEENAVKNKIAIMPTILWGDAKAMHKVFSNQRLLDSHINAIVAFLRQHDFSGVDIDYEGKDVTDRDNFSNFLRVLHGKLKAENKTLSCTVEARTQDDVPTGWSGTRAMAWTNDFKTLNNECDSVRIMAYDQVFQQYGTKSVFENQEAQPYAPNADSRWVEDVVKYALKYISPTKLVLGIPTYGWEFQVEKTASGFRYTRFQSVSYPKAIQEAQNAGVEREHTKGGEMSFVYKAPDGQHIVTFSDSEAVKEKINLAKKYHLEGISLFKLDGQGDPSIFSVLKENNSSKQ